jgi:hypothetical protein
MVYPNPCNGVFTIGGLEKGHVSIYSISGKFILNQELEGTTLIDLSQMESGVYLVQVEGKGVAFVSKLD